MKRTIQRGFAMLGLAALLLACGREAAAPAPVSQAAAPTARPTTRPAPTPTTAPTTLPTALSEEDLEARWNLQVANNKGMEISLMLGGSGPHAGTYAVTSPDAICGGGLAANERDSVWATKFADTASEPNEFSGLKFTAVIEEGKDESIDFSITISFGELDSAAETKYELMVMGDNLVHGSGMVTVADRGETATLLISGAAADGSQVEARLECLSVVRIR
ncbi:MAG: hypothetical protein H0T53_07630 [Herpetosiphonaceae bacterium]|nr:hypothetical protein [Herpetosiphonaceae bacterium]